MKNAAESRISMYAVTDEWNTPEYNHPENSDTDMLLSNFSFLSIEKEATPPTHVWENICNKLDAQKPTMPASTNPFKKIISWLNKHVAALGIM